MRSLSVDPGVLALGWALWESGTLSRCGLSSMPRSMRPDLPDCAQYHVRTIALHAALGGLSEVAIESMEWRPGDVRSNPADLLAVQTVGCLTARACAPHVILYPPRVWKGTIPKDVHHKRIMEALNPQEREIVRRALDDARASGHKEILDAIGVGLVHHKRTNRSGGLRR